jgi:glycosyltransferase involved in cell wall biosynthesis
MNQPIESIHPNLPLPGKLVGRPIRVCYPFVGDDIGGSHISAIKLIEHLDPSRFEPRVILHQADGLLADHLRKRGLHFEPAPDVFLPDPIHINNGFDAVKFALSYFTGSLPGLRSFLRRERIDILHTNDGRIHALWALAAWGSATRHVWHHRGDPQARATNILAPLCADHIVTVSRFARPAKPVRNIDKRWSVVHSPFDHPDSQFDFKAFRRRLIEEIGCSENARFLGYFGLLLDRKRPSAMADILFHYKSRYPDEPVHVVIFGRPAEGADRVEESVVVQRAEELGVADRIHLMGFRDPVEPWMGAVDINLIPAINEPFGRTLIEAMLLGIPVIATRHGGNPEAIEDDVNGFLVEADNPAAFVDPVRRLLNDATEFTRISDTARSQALRAYGISKHVQAISDIYMRLARNHDPAKAGRGV